MRTAIGRSGVGRGGRGAGFTLVELLVVIGIIALLISVLLPTINRARKAGNNVYCQANLRQIGQALVMYSNANRGFLPYDTFDGVWDGNPSGARNTKGTDFTVLLSATLGRAGSSWGDQKTDSGSVRGIFRDVDVVSVGQGNMLGSNDGNNHYSCNPRIMGNIEQANGPYHWEPWMPPYKLASIKYPYEIVLVFDGVQIGSFGYNASPEAFSIDGFRLFFDHFLRREYAEANKMDLSLPVDGGDNTDSVDWGGNAGNIRWRHMSNRSANFLFCDGHVEARKYKNAQQNELQRRNICVYSQDDTPPREHALW